MPIYTNVGYCPKNKKNIIRCVEIKDFKEVDCRYWKKDIGCTYKEA